MTIGTLLAWLDSEPPRPIGADPSPVPPASTAPYQGERLFDRLLAAHRGVLIDLDVIRSCPAGDSGLPLVTFVRAMRRSQLPCVLLRLNGGAEPVDGRLPQGWSVQEANLREGHAAVRAAAEAGGLPADGLLAVTVPETTPHLAGSTAVFASQGGWMIGPPVRRKPLTATEAHMIAAIAEGLQQDSIVSQMAPENRWFPNTFSRFVHPRGYTDVFHMLGRSVVDGFLDPDPIVRAAPWDLDRMDKTFPSLFARCIATSTAAVAAERRVTSGAIHGRLSHGYAALGARGRRHALVLALGLGIVPDSVVPPAA
ncbi:hypothetical protein ACFVT9_28470 [Kitasatospora cineracea]|uniref:hypothetical protein n=1 Tax=Kitasatospora cineracea TaxID=88074 RepID=UPI0036D7A42D